MTYCNYCFITCICMFNAYSISPRVECIILKKQDDFVVCLMFACKDASGAEGKCLLLQLLLSLFL